MKVQLDPIKPEREPKNPVQNLAEYTNPKYGYTIRVGEKVVYFSTSSGELRIGILLEIKTTLTVWGITRYQVKIDPLKQLNSNYKMARTTINYIDNIAPAPELPDDNK